MTADREELTDRRDEALRDLVELERQVEAGEIPGTTAEHIRGDYERAVADALAALERAERSAGPSTTVRRRSRGTVIVYVITAAVALIALIVVLPNAIGARPPGGAVTGNELLQTATTVPPTSAPGMPSSGAGSTGRNGR